MIECEKMSDRAFPIKKVFSLVLVFAALSTVTMVEFLFFRNSIVNVSAVETVGEVGVYWNRNCGQKVYSIDWGNLSRGETKSVSVYVRNEGNEPFFLVLTPANWSPDETAYYLKLSWDCEDIRIEAGEVVKVTQFLYVSYHVRGISNFSFDIIFKGREHLLGDVDGDGVVDIFDYQLVRYAVPSVAGDPRWNPNADFDDNGVIDLVDLQILKNNFGQHYP